MDQPTNSFQKNMKFQKETSGLSVPGIVGNGLKNKALTGKSKKEHSKTTLRIYRAESLKFIEWLGEKCPDFKQVRLDTLIQKYLDSSNRSDLIKKTIRCALNYKSRNRRVETINKEIFTLRPDAVRFSQLVKLSGQKGVPKAPSPI